MDKQAIVNAFVAATLPFLLVKLTSWIKYLSAGQFREAWTQLVPWGLGIGLLALTAHSDLGGFELLGTNLNKLDGGALVILGLSFGSTGSFAFDWKKARDNTDSAAEPPLGGGPVNTQP